MSKKRGGEVRFAVPKGRANPSVVSGQGHSVVSATHSWNVQRFSRRSQQARQDSEHRVDPLRESARPSVDRLVQTDGGPLCHSVQCQTASVCLPSGRSRRMEGRRAKHRLVGSRSLRVSSDSAPKASGQKGATRETKTHSRCTFLAGADLVSRADGIGRTTNPTQLKERGPVSTQVPGSSRKPGSAQPSRVEVVQLALAAQGASTQITDLVPRSVRRSTSTVYDTYWKRWVSWCERHMVNATSPSRMDFANFLAFLGQTLKLSVASVRCHRAAISTTIKQAGGPSFSEDQLLKDVTKALALDCVTTARRVPLWDLSLVLKSLSVDPYEPINSSSLKFLTYKTIFLLTLALGRRGSEIHGLSGLSGDTRFEQDGSVSVRFLPEFLAKNQNPGQSNKPLIVKSLSSIGDREDVDISLCPVRALRAYLERSKSVRHKRLRRLFVSLNSNYEKDLSKATLARWLVETIKLAYAKAGSIPLSTRPHELRAIAASLAAAHNIALNAILDAAFWKTENTFINFYLRDISARDESGCRRLPVVVAAQQVLQ